MPPAPAVSVVIPVHGNFALTRDCLKSLARTAGQPLEVIVADNGSTDETPRELRALGSALFGPLFRHIRFEENRNFAPACNAGARAASADFVFFLNNDTVLTQGWLPPLLRRFRSVPRLGAAGPLLTYADGTVQHLGVAFKPGYKLGHLYKGLPATHPLAQKRRFFKALTAAALLMPRGLFLSAGGFDEGFVNGYEDVDLSLRLTSAGLSLASVPESRVIHLESKTPTRFAHEEANGLRLLGKWRLDRLVDMPDHVAADGYALTVMPELELRLTTNPAVSAELLAKLETFDPALCRELLEKEPLWEEGYSLLGAHLENSGQAAEALELYRGAARCKNSCSFQDYERILRVETALGRDTSGTRASLGRLTATLGGQEYARKREHILETLAGESPAQQALIPHYERAYKEGLRLAASAALAGEAGRKGGVVRPGSGRRTSRRRR
ncbi:glycosyltransferase family 2 protein [Desulfovibrio sp.]|uniref:glycosyltransferase family 2 protein n=1 Tax=Desulfovibrio sp. TaxID=885 RepID=UPI0023D6D2B3|nr:glycosyltransferase family 2 protein [Desulfovibrio sp.]MDE7241303.1 glycosyltransferase family 2 protein [Desulfovibrio sp.]